MCIAYNEHVCVALVTRHAMHVHHIVTCGLPCSTSFFHIAKAVFFWGGGGNVENKNVCFDFL